MPRPGSEEPCCPSDAAAGCGARGRGGLLLGSCSGPAECGPAMSMMMMMRRRRRRRAHWMLLLFCFCLLAFPSHGPLPVEAFVGAYGINYGRIANDIPSPDKVAALLRASKIRNVKIYDADHSVLDAFKWSGLNLVIAIPNEYLKDFAANESRSMDWLNDNVQSYLPQSYLPRYSCEECVQWTEETPFGRQN